MPTKPKAKPAQPKYSLWKENKSDYVINKDWKPTKYTTMDKTPEAKKVINTLNRKKK